jgi:hypothetical protein
MEGLLLTRACRLVAFPFLAALAAGVARADANAPVKRWSFEHDA